MQPVQRFLLSYTETAKPGHGGGPRARGHARASQETARWSGPAARDRRARRRPARRIAPQRPGLTAGCAASRRQPRTAADHEMQLQMIDGMGILRVLACE